MQRVLIKGIFAFAALALMLSFRDGQSLVHPVPGSVQFEKAIFDGALIAPGLLPVPESRPPLMLSLDDPAAAVYGSGGRSDSIPIMDDRVVVKPTPTSGLIGTLSRFEVTVDDKRRPIVHYHFAKNSAESRKAEERAITGGDGR